MLAERRSKVKYILNPRKCNWSADESNFGRRLMKQMGWSDGKGLGREEKGSTEPVKVSYKNDSKGMGYKGTPDNSVHQQDEFSQLLAELNHTEDVVVTNPNAALPTSLEKRSESSRSRLHYQKFTRGKDLSRYTEKDLACIVGKGKAKQPEPVEEQNFEEPSGDNEETSFGVQTTKGGLIGDYFKKKMQALNLGKLPLSEMKMDHRAENIDDQEENENKFEKKKGKRKNLSEDEKQDLHFEETNFKKAKIGKRKKKNTCENPKEEIVKNGFQRSLDDASARDMKKKKRKKTQKNLSSKGYGCDITLKSSREKKRKLDDDSEEDMSNIHKRNKKQKYKI